MSDARLISNSEVGTYQECQMRHWFAYILRVKPKLQPDWAEIGTIGHAALAEYYTSLKDGNTFKESVATIPAYLDGYVDNLQDLVDSGHINETEFRRKEVFADQVGLLLANYVSRVAANDKWEVLEVEKMHSTKNGYAMRLDLLIRDHGDRGAIVIVDHKFLSKFISWQGLAMNCQVPKYIGTLAEEIEVDYGVMNQILKKKEGAKYTPKFERAKVPYEPQVFEQRLQEQEIMAEKIRPLYDMPIMEAKKQACRVNNYWLCERCLYREPCEQDLKGSDMMGEIEYNFEENTYGYSAGQE